MIKVVMAKSIIDVMETNGGNSLAAAERGIELLKRKVDGYGGVIVMNHHGNVGVAFNTPRMARAYIHEGMAEPVIAV